MRVIVARVSDARLSATKRQDRRAQIGRLLATAIHQHRAAEDLDMGQPFVPGAGACRHTWWDFPMCSSEAAAMIATLRSCGFDATQGSQLQPVEPQTGSEEQYPAEAASVVSKMIFLPLYSELSDAAVERLINTIPTAQ